MAVPGTWPSGNNGAAGPYDGGFAGAQPPPARAPSGQQPAHALIGEMAGLLRDIRGSIAADGALLGAIMIGFALEARLAGQMPREALARIADLGLLGGMLLCWLVAIALLARASRPALSTLSELRWVTGAPLDPRPRWVTLPPAGADPAEWTLSRAYLLLGAARLVRSRMWFADTWTYFTGGCFMAWTMIAILGR
ncbi:MAG: hypothetical protein ACRDNW_21080 [Trebonia sp.]